MLCHIILLFGLVVQAAVSQTCGLFPGATVLGRGVDCTVFDINAVDAASGGWLFPLVDLDVLPCGPACFCAALNETFACYDQMDTPIFETSVVSNGGYFELHTREDVQAFLSATYSVGASTLFGSFERSATATKWFQMLESEDMTIAGDWGLSSAEKVQLFLDDLVPNQHFANYYGPVLDLIPWYKEGNYQRVYEAFATYGTHICVKAILGGRWSSTYFVQNFYFSAAEGQSLQQNVEDDFLSVLKVSGGYSGNTQNASALFYNLSVRTLAQEGGSKFTSVPVWLESIPLAPAVIQAAFEPVSNLVSNNTQSENFASALVMYVADAGMTSLRTSVARLNASVMAYALMDDVTESDCACGPCDQSGFEALQAFVNSTKTNARQILGVLNTLVSEMDVASITYPVYNLDNVPQWISTLDSILATITTSNVTMTCSAMAYCDPPYGTCCSDNACQFKTYRGACGTPAVNCREVVVPQALATGNMTIARE